MAEAKRKNVGRTNWCFTSYQIQDIKFTPDMKYLVYQTEKCPDTGRLHVQGFVQFAKRHKLNAVKELLHDQSVHLEVMKGTPQEASDYCQKADSRHPGPAACNGEMVTAGQRTDIQGLKRKILEGSKWVDLASNDDTVQVLARHNSFAKELIAATEEKKGLDYLRKKYDDVELKTWQDELTGECQHVPDDRHIMWICDEKGGNGKSWWANYMVVQEDALLISPSKFPDMAYLWKSASPETKTVVFDVTRSNQSTDKYSPLLGAYQLAEHLKNGIVASTKYQPQMIHRQH